MNAKKTGLLISELGKVSIGTKTPTASVHISSDDMANLFRVDDVSNDATPFVIDDDGNVGIGTQNPQQALDVNGQLRISGGSPAAGKILAATNSNGDAEWSTPTPTCNWSGGKWVSHGWDGACAWPTGIYVYCNNGKVTAMQWFATPACPPVK